MKINRLEFVGALKKVMPGIEGKETLLEGADSFMFDNEWIKTFNDSISVSYPFKTGMNCLIKAQEFFKLLTKIESSEVEMEIEEDKLVLNAGNTNVKMVLMDSSNLVSLVDNLSLENCQWIDLPIKFIDAVKTCIMFSTTNQTYASLCGISIGKDGIVSSDNFRAGWYHIELDVSEDFVLMTEAAKDLINIKDINQYSLGNAWIHFHSEEGLLFSVRKITIDFPRESIKDFLDFSDVINQKKYSFPDKMIKSVERAAILASVNPDGNEYVQIQLDKKNNLVIKGSKHFGEIEDKISPDNKWEFPKDFVLKMNPKYFGDLLSVDNKFYIGKEQQYILMRNGNFDSIISLINTD